MKRLTVLLFMTAFGFAGRPFGKKATEGRSFNGPYQGPYLNRLAFPIGGIGAGMFCLEGAGAMSHLSVRNVLQFLSEPCTFAAVCVKGETNVARILEGPVPSWKIFGTAGTGNGASGMSYGLPRFKEASFLVRFPFGKVTLEDARIPSEVSLTGWSPFIPGDADNSSLPVGELEYSFSNPTGAAVEAVAVNLTILKSPTVLRQRGLMPSLNHLIIPQTGPDTMASSIFSTGKAPSTSTGADVFPTAFSVSGWPGYADLKRSSVWKRSEAISGPSTSITSNMT